MSITKYRQFLERVQPRAVALDGCTVKLDRPAYARMLGKESDARPVSAIRVKYELGEVEDDYFDVTGELTLETGPDQAAPALTIQCAFTMHFHGSQPSERALAEQFAQQEARLVIWPYFREFVSSLTGKMGISHITLPLVLRQPRRQKSSSRTKGGPSRRSSGASGKRRRARTAGS